MRRFALALQRFRARARLVALHLHERFGPFVEALAVLLFGFAFLLIAQFRHIGSVSDWASFFASFLVAALTVYFLRQATYKQTLLMEVTMAYLIEGGKSLLDHLLGKLISGAWHRTDFVPGRSLFRAVREVAVGSDWEMRRRVAEALPALAEIDESETLNVAAILRDDWDEDHWHSDVRRRTVEALVIPLTK